MSRKVRSVELQTPHVIRQVFPHIALLIDVAQMWERVESVWGVRDVETNKVVILLRVRGDISAENLRFLIAGMHFERLTPNNYERVELRYEVPPLQHNLINYSHFVELEREY